MAEEDAAARAFNGLAAEVGVLRRAVEGFEEKLNRAKARNYDATLGALREATERTAERLDAMERHPALSLAPDDWTRQIRSAAATQRDELRQELEIARRQVQDAAGQVRTLAVDVATTRQQQRSEWVAGGVGVAAGLVLSMAIVAAIMALPAGWHVREKLAAVLMGEDRWTAGQRLMRSADPDGWRRVLAETQLASDNAAAVAACRKAAEEAGREQKCVIRVDPTARAPQSSRAAAQ